MSLFGWKEKKELERLKQNADPNAVHLTDLQTQIAEAEKKLSQLNQKVQAEEQQIQRLKAQVIETDEAILMQGFGMYTPHYAYEVSDDYKEALSKNREAQKKSIRENRAVVGGENWAVNGSKAQGKKMVNDMKKLLLRAFNAECDDAVEHVRFNNIGAAEKKITASFDAICKLGTVMGISLSSNYLKLKLSELRLMHEYQLKKQEEKECAKELRAQQREEAKAAKELAEARKKLEKEHQHYTNALNSLTAQIAKATAEQLPALEAKKAELEGQISTIGAELQDVDYRTANQKAGYVYIISNIGAFGKDVYKIGMTRRLEPMDRIDELGGASVPFNFDVHALIFTDNAPALEAALHNAFADKKVNFVNQRREFFRVSLEEIKEVIRKNYDKTVEFVDEPPAQQYRESLLLKEKT